MSDETPEQNGGTDAPDAAALAAQVEQLQSEIDTWKGHARKHEDRAKANADAATRVTELENEVAALKDAAAGVPAQVAAALKSHIVDIDGISQETADTLLTATEPDALLAQVKALKGLAPAGASAPLEGTTAPAGSDTESPLARAFLDALKASADS